MIRHKAFGAVALLLAVVPTPGMADAAHEASAMAWMDGHPSTLAIRILPDTKTLVLTLDRELETTVKCDVLNGLLAAYIVNGYNQTIRVGCWQMSARGVTITWSDGVVTEMGLAAFIINPKLD